MNVFLPALINGSTQRGFALDGLRALGVVPDFDAFAVDVSVRVEVGRLLRAGAAGYWERVQEALAEDTDETPLRGDGRRVFDELCAALDDQDWRQAETLASVLVCGERNQDRIARMVKAVLRAKGPGRCVQEYDAWKSGSRFGVNRAMSIIRRLWKS